MSFLNVIDPNSVRYIYVANSSNWFFWNSTLKSSEEKACHSCGLATIQTMYVEILTKYEQSNYGLADSASLILGSPIDEAPTSPFGFHLAHRLGTLKSSQLY